MSFIIDKQTLDDLGIFSRNRDVSVFGIYNSVHTRGGARILEEMFTNPLDDVEKIRSRSEVIGFFREAGLDFPFKASWFDAAEFYLTEDAAGEKFFFHFDFYNLAALDQIIQDREFVEPESPDYSDFLKQAERLRNGEQNWFVGALYYPRFLPDLAFCNASGRRGISCFWPA